MVGQITDEMRAALRTRAPVLVGLLEVNLPGYDLLLLDGASVVEWDGKRFVGMDPVYGSWASSDAFASGVGDNAPAFTFTLAPTSVADAATLTEGEVQGSRVRVWFAVIDVATGQPVPSPMLLFDGLLDQPVLTFGPRTFSLEYKCVSGFEPLMITDEGIRLSDAHHQDLWPGELGLGFMTGLIRTIIWGPGDRPGGVSNYGSGGGGGRGGFFGWQYQR